jgi:hypothetical protein
MLRESSANRLVDYYSVSPTKYRGTPSQKMFSKNSEARGRRSHSGVPGLDYNLKYDKSKVSFGNNNV